MSILSLKCDHTPKKYVLEYKCQTTGNYTLELCDQCRKTESNDFLIREGRL